jgi:hypothetical protein
MAALVRTTDIASGACPFTTPTSELAGYLSANTRSRVEWMQHVAARLSDALEQGSRRDQIVALRVLICDMRTHLSMASAFLSRTNADQAILVMEIFKHETLEAKRAEFSRSKVLNEATVAILRDFARSAFNDAVENDYSFVFRQVCDLWHENLFSAAIARAKQEPFYFLPFLESIKKMQEDALARIKRGENYKIDPAEIERMSTPVQIA